MTSDFLKAEDIQKILEEFTKELAVSVKEKR